MSAERLFRWSAFAWAGLGLLLIAGLPDVVREGFGNHRLPVVMHAFTLGAFVNGYYGLQPTVWLRVYGRPAPWPRLAPFIWVLHQTGVALMVAGFLRAGLAVANIGAHYLIPMGMVLHAGLGVLALRRRAPGAGRHAGCHVPALGMLLAMGLGAMILLDQTTGRYGLYTPPTLLVHGMSGAFLFLLPALWLHGAVHATDPADAPALRRATGGLLLRIVPLALGIGMVVIGLMPDAPGLALPGGLALLGATLLWGAFPMARGRRAATAGWLRAGWAAPGLLLLFAALRTVRGLESAEGYLLARNGAVAVVLVAGLPELVTGLASPPATVQRIGRDWARVGGSLMAASGLAVLAGLGLDSGLVIQAGAAGVLGGLLLAALGGGRRR